MSTTTIEDQLAEIRRRIDRLQALAQAGVAAERARIQRHLDALHQEEASVLAAARRAPDEVEEKLGQLRTRLAVAEHSLAADVSDDWATFAAAVEDGAPQLGHLPRAAADERRGEGVEGARAGRGGDRRRPHPPDRRRRAPRAGARRRRRRLAGAEEARHRGSRRARTEGRRTVHEVELKGAET